MRAFLYLDFFSPAPVLHFKSQEGYKTIFGAIMTIVGFITVFTFILYFFINFLVGTEYYIVTSQENKFSKSVNLTDSIFFYKLMYGDDGTNVPSTVAKILPTYWNYSESDIIKSTLNTSSCSREKNYPDEKYDSVLDFDISSFTCIDPGQEVIIRNEEETKLANYMNFYIAKCTEEVDGNCESDSEIESILENRQMYLSLYVQTTGVDHEKKNPFYIQYNYDQIIVSKDFFYVTYFNFRKLIYTSDDGPMFQNINKYKSFKFDIKTRSSDIYKSVTTSVPGALMVLQFNIYDNYAEKYERTYSKFQSFLANVGGICNFVMIIVQFIEVFASKNLMYRDIWLEVQNLSLSSDNSPTAIKEKGYLFKPLMLVQNQNQNLNQNQQSVSSTSQQRIQNSNNSRIIIPNNIEENLRRKSSFFKYTLKKLSFADTIRYRFCFWKRNSDSKLKFMRDCEESVKKGLSCEEMIKSNELVKFLVFKNKDLYTDNSLKFLYTQKFNIEKKS